MTRTAWLLGPVALAAAAAVTLSTTSAPPPPGDLPFSEPDLVNPLRGQYENLLTGPFPQTSELNRDLPAWPGVADVSVRIPWSFLQPKDPRTVPADAADTEKYSFDQLDTYIADAAKQGKRVGFRVTAFNSCCDATKPGDVVTTAPAWLRTLPGASTTAVKDGVSYVIPRWNDAAYLDAFTGLVEALGRRYDRDERVAVFEFSGYGDFSENHMSFARDSLGAPGPAPERSRAELGYFSQYRDQTLTAASANRLVGTTLRAFRSTQIVSPMGNPEIARLLLRDHPDLAGLRRPVGIRADSLGGMEIFPTWAQNRWSQYVIDRDPLIGVLAQRYRTAPVLSEWSPQLLTGGTDLEYYRRGANDVVRQHVSSTSSTGFPAQSRPERMTAEQYELWERANKYAGYRYSAATLGPRTTDDGRRVLDVRWTNAGSAPTHDRWAVTYDLLDTLGRVRASIPGAVDLAGLLTTEPYAGAPAVPPAAEVTDTVELPYLRPGTYSLRVRVQWDERKPDATHTVDLAPMALAQTGRDTGGGYPAGTVELGR